MAAMIAIAMPAAIRPYSIAVAPDSSAKNLRMVFMPRTRRGILKGQLNPICQTRVPLFSFKQSHIGNFVLFRRITELNRRTTEKDGRHRLSRVTQRLAPLLRSTQSNREIEFWLRPFCTAPIGAIG